MTVWRFPARAVRTADTAALAKGGTSATIGFRWDPTCIHMPYPPKPLESVSERTYQAVLDSIVSRRIGPGEVLEERRLADELAVSRTPMRAALNRLLGEGILARLSNGSVIVKAFGATELLEFLQVRTLLEGEAAALAAGRIPPARLQEVRERLQAILEQTMLTEQQDWSYDNEVHNLVAQHCGNRTMAAMIADVRLRARLCNVERIADRWLLARQEHLAILDALGRADAEAARAAMVAHLANVRQAYLKTLGYLGQ